MSKVAIEVRCMSIACVDGRKCHGVPCPLEKKCVCHHASEDGKSGSCSNVCKCGNVVVCAEPRVDIEALRHKKVRVVGKCPKCKKDVSRYLSYSRFWGEISESARKELFENADEAISALRVVEETLEDVAKKVEKAAAVVDAAGDLLESAVDVAKANAGKQPRAKKQKTK